MLIEAVDRKDPRPLYVTIWGGANTLAQALWQVRENRSPEEVKAFVSQLRVYTMSDQGHSLRIDLDMLVVTASPARTALKISQLTDGGMPPTYDSMH
jgi:hypothetical protein